MKLSKREKRMVANVLRDCLSRLWDGAGSHTISGKTAYICFAIGNGSRAKDMTKWLIESRLDGFGSVRAWLSGRAKISGGQLTNERVQAHRIAWVKHLIAELEAE